MHLPDIDAHDGTVMVWDN